MANLWPCWQFSHHNLHSGIRTSYYEVARLVLFSSCYKSHYWLFTRSIIASVYYNGQHTQWVHEIVGGCGINAFHIYIHITYDCGRVEGGQNLERSIKIDTQNSLTHPHNIHTQHNTCNIHSIEIACHCAWHLMSIWNRHNTDQLHHM